MALSSSPSVISASDTGPTDHIITAPCPENTGFLKFDSTGQVDVQASYDGVDWFDLPAYHPSLGHSNLSSDQIVRSIPGNILLRLNVDAVGTSLTFSVRPCAK